MDTVITEGALTFTFGAAWHVAKYDETTYYRKHMAALQGTVDGKLKDSTAADIVGIQPGLLAIIEVKDFRGFGGQNRSRLATAELAKEVGFKVRDTVAGVVGAYRFGTDDAMWRPLASGLPSRKHTLKVVLWLEQGPPNNPLREKQEFSMFTQELKKACKWLTPRVLVVSKSTFAAALPDLAVSG